MSDSAGASEVVMFMSDSPEEKGVCKEMMFTEFEAVLDGVVGLDDYAGQTKKGVFIIINGLLQATACALFLIKFDKNGCADKSWNIPLRHLAETGGMGPDMGAGSIRLACRSQCSVAWHQGAMWDPNMQPGSNTFVYLRDAILRNRLCLVKASMPSVAQQSFQDYSQQLPGDAQPLHQQQPQMQPMQHQQLQPQHSQPQHSQPQHSQPQHSQPQHSPQYSQQSPQQSPQQFQQQPMYPQGYPTQPNFTQHQSAMPAQGQVAGQFPQPVSNDFSDADLQSRWKKLETDQRNKIAKLIKAQRLHISTLDKRREEQVAKIKYEFAREKEELVGEIKQLRQQVASLHKQNMAVREQCEAQRAQMHAVGGLADEKITQVQEHGRIELEAMAEKYENLFDERINEESAKLKEEIQLRDMELMYRHEVTKQLREELTLLRKDKIRLVNSGAEHFLDRLENLGISFIAFHPGAGHISIPLAEMADYIDSPVTYAAKKCLVTEEEYRTWVAHYDNPICNAHFSEAKSCDARVIRIDVPSEYVPGNSDRCDKHRNGAAGGVNLPQ